MNIFGTVLPYLGFREYKVFNYKDLNERYRPYVDSYLDHTGAVQSDILLMEIKMFSVGWFNWYMNFTYGLECYLKEED